MPDDKTEPDSKEKIGAVLRIVRSAVRASSSDVAHELLQHDPEQSLSPDYLLKIERGERGNDELHETLASLFGLSLTDVIAFAGRHPNVDDVASEPKSREFKELIGRVNAELRPRRLPKRPRSSRAGETSFTSVPRQASPLGPVPSQPSLGQADPSAFPAALPGFSGGDVDTLARIASMPAEARESVMLMARAAYGAIRNRKLEPLWDLEDGEVRGVDLPHALIEHVDRLARLGVPGWPLVDLPVGQIAYVDGRDVYCEGEGTEAIWWVRKRAWALRLGQRYQHVAILVLPGDQLLVDTTSAGETLDQAPLSLTDQWRPADHTGELPPAFPREAYTETVVELRLKGYPVWTIVPRRRDGDPVEPVENPVEPDEILNTLGVNSIGIVSAWNPGGRQLSRAKNEHRNRLLADLAAATIEGLAIGRAPTAEAEGEEGLVIANATVADVHRLAASGVDGLGQNGGFLLDRQGWKVVLALTATPTVLAVPIA